MPLRGSHRDLLDSLLGGNRNGDFDHLGDDPRLPKGELATSHAAPDATSACPSFLESRCLRVVFADTPVFRTPCPAPHPHVAAVRYKTAPADVKLAVQKRSLAEITQLQNRRDGKLAELSQAFKSRITGIRNPADISRIVDSCKSLHARVHAGGRDISNLLSGGAGLVWDMTNAHVSEPSDAVVRAFDRLTAVQQDSAQFAEARALVKNEADMRRSQAAASTVPCKRCAMTLQASDGDERVLEHFVGKIHQGFVALDRESQRLQTIVRLADRAVDTVVAAPGDTRPPEPKVFPRLSDTEVQALRDKYSITTTALHAPPPLRALAELATINATAHRLAVATGFSTPTPVQRQCWTAALAHHDCVIDAPTGSGKTLAFALPMAVRALGAAVEGDGNVCSPAALALLPTRELAVQVASVFASMGNGLKIGIAIGGGADGSDSSVPELCSANVLVATPGRLLDLLRQRMVNFDSLTCLALDEADKMLPASGGHRDDVLSIMDHIGALKNRVSALRGQFVVPQRCPVQVFLASATAENMLSNLGALLYAPVPVSASGGVNITESVLVCGDERTRNSAICTGLQGCASAVVFTDTRANVSKVVSMLRSHGLSAVEYRGDMPQAAREAAVTDFSSGAVQILVATDVAGRGLDVTGVEVVVNIGVVETADYRHRIGRTGRAGASGVATTYILTSETDEAERLIIRPQRALGRTITVSKY